MNEQQDFLLSVGLAALLVIALLTAVTPAQALAAEFIALGDLPGGDFYSTAYAVSDDGRTVFGVGQIGTTSSDRRLFRWTDVDGIGDPLSSSYVGVTDASADGSVAVGSDDGGWRWTEDTGFIPLVTRKKKIIDTSPQGVSADGSIIVGNKSGVPFRWTEATGVVNLPMFQGHTSRANDVSGDGTVVAGRGDRRNRSSSFPLYWIGNSDPFVIPPPAGLDSSRGNGFAVSPDGTVVTGLYTYSNGNIGFRWEITTGDMKILGQGWLPEPQLTVPWDTSFGGEFIVGNEGTADGRAARIWDAVHGARDLQDVLEQEYDLADELAGWHLRVARRISPDGQNIVGYGTNPTENTEAFLVRLGGSPTSIPEPAAMVLLLAGLTLLGTTRARK